MQASKEAVIMQMYITGNTMVAQVGQDVGLTMYISRLNKRVREGDSVLSLGISWPLKILIAQKYWTLLHQTSKQPVYMTHIDWQDKS